MANGEEFDPFDTGGRNEKIVQTAKAESIDLVVVGPEVPLCTE